LRRTKPLPPADFREAFQRAFEAICARARSPLGNVTLSVILERVLHETRVRFPSFKQARQPSSTERYDLRRALEALEAVRPAELVPATRFFLIVLIGVLGHLTGDILTRPLHSVLWRMRLTPSPEDSGLWPRDRDELQKVGTI
jgi:hypothetical protein